MEPGLGQSGLVHHKGTFYNIFSFSFDTEILNLFGNVYDKLYSYQGNPGPIPVEQGSMSPQIIPIPGSGTDSIFRILVSPVGSKAYSANPVIATIQYTVITSGILVVVGISSYLTYKFLREIGSMNLIQLKRNYANLVSKLKLISGTQTKPAATTSQKDLVPLSEFLLTSHAKAAASSTLSQEVTVKNNNLSHRKVVSGDESGSDVDEGEIEPQYFGPSPFPGYPS